MIIIPGVLSVFNRDDKSEKSEKVGRLECELGKFQVKYENLNILDEGHYKGSFSIVQVSPTCFLKRGKIILEQEAVINHIYFSELADQGVFLKGKKQALQKRLQINETSEDFHQHDFFEEEKRDIKEFPAENEEDVQITENTEKAENAHDSEEAEDIVLFGELWPLQDEVKQDATVSREKLSQQAVRLYKHGYRYIMPQQIWVKR